jgi:hypothetical protein
MATTPSELVDAHVDTMATRGWFYDRTQWVGDLTPLRRFCGVGRFDTLAFAWLRHSGNVVTRVDPSVPEERRFAQRASASLGTTRTLGARPGQASQTP